MPGKIEQYSSGTARVPAEVFLPQGATRAVAAVLVIHGSSGLAVQYKADIESFAEALAHKGIGALLPHYFVATGLKADTDGLQLIPTHYDAWKTACKDAVLHMARDSRFEASRLGVLGFSLGGHFALGLGMAPPTGVVLKSVVDFFAPTLSPPLNGNWTQMPPLLIHHGLSDQLVPLENSEYLRTQLQAGGKKEGQDFRLETYPGQGHGFTGDDLTTARTRTVDFFLSTL